MMTKKEFMNYILYGDSSGPGGAIDERTDWVAEQIKKKVAESMLEEIKTHPLPFRRYSPGNPMSKEWLSNLPPIAVPIHPEIIRPIDTSNFWFDQCRLGFSERPFEEKLIISINTPKEKTVMQAKAVFDLYFKRAEGALEKAYEDKFFEIVEADENIKLIKATFEGLNKELKDLDDQPGFSLFPSRDNFRLHCTNSTKDKVDQLSKQEAEEEQRLHELREEIESQLISCETYDQARAVLRTYEIIDISGKMCEYKPSF